MNVDSHEDGPARSTLDDAVIGDSVAAATTARQARPPRPIADAELTFAQLVVRRPMVGVGALGFALAVGLTRGITAPPQVVLALFGWGWCLWLARSAPKRRAAPERLSVRGTSVWVGVAAAFTAIELYSFSIDEGLSYEHPTLSTLVDPALDTFPVRFVAAVVWLAAGWHLVRR